MDWLTTLIGHCPIGDALNDPKEKKRHPLDQIGNVHWHLVDLCAVVLLDIAENLDVVLSDKVDGNTLATETSRATNTKIALWWK